MNQQTKRIEAYSIHDYSALLQEAVLEGYRLNLEDSEKFPLQIGVGFYAVMDKKGIITEAERQCIIEDVTKSQLEFSVGVTTPAMKPGRKPKA